MSKKKTARERDTLKEQLLQMASDPDSPGSSQAKKATKTTPAKKKAATKKPTAKKVAAKMAKKKKVKKNAAEQSIAPATKFVKKSKGAPTSAGVRGAVEATQSESKQSAARPALQGREAQAIRLVERFAKGAMVPGAIPIPLIDAAAISGVQLKMLHSLCKIYNTPFSAEIGRSAIASFAGGVGSAAFGVGAGTIVHMLLKTVPFVGLAAGMAGISGFGYASTYAIGKVFVEHFEGGETLLTFDASKVTRASTGASKDPHA